MTQTQLSNELSLPKQTVNSALKTLETEGFVRLEGTAGNLKNKLVVLTEQGNAFLRGSIDQVQQLEYRAISHLTEKERDQILALGGRQLEAFREEAEKILGKDGD